MHKLDELKLRMYRERLGPLTAEGALELALQAEEIARMNDPASGHFAQRKEEFERYAYLLDMEARAKQGVSDE